MVRGRGHGTASACRRGRCRGSSPCRTRGSWGRPNPRSEGPSWRRHGSPPGRRTGPRGRAHPVAAGSAPPGPRAGSAPCSGTARGAPRRPAPSGSSLQGSARRPVRTGRAPGRPPRRLEPRPPLPGISYTAVILATPLAEHMNIAKLNIFRGFHLRRKIVAAYQQHVDYRREAALLMWVAFIATFVFLRLLTFGIRYHLLPVKNVVTSSGLHIHHFVWGIVILLIVGFLGITIWSERLHPWLATIFGIGAALVIDEYALWLNLQDVYWLPAGRSSVDIAILIAAVLGLYYAADRFWKTVVMEVQGAIKFVSSEEGRLFRARPRATATTTTPTTK